MELGLTGRMMDAEEAERWGLVNRLTEKGGALDGARALAAEIASNAPLSVAATKRMVSQSPRWPEESVWDRQDAELEPVINSEDAREGAASFTEKREPVWKGR